MAARSYASAPWGRGVLLPSLLVLTAACGGGLCENVELDRVPHPGGVSEALVWQRDCGALTTGPVTVEVVRPGGAIGSGGVVAELEWERSCPDGSAPLVAWDPKVLRLVVTYHSDSQVKLRTRYDQVQVTYRHCEATYSQD